MNRVLRNYKMPVKVFGLTFGLLAIVQVKLVDHPLILLERFVRGGGWFEIVVISLYGAFVAFKMQNPMYSARWRKVSWNLFSLVFFSQLILGLLFDQRFLMTGKLHLPIPMMILGGPLYRGHLSVMTILFLSTIIISGTAWCSQLCYFGAFDNMLSKGKTTKVTFQNKKAIKTTIMLLVILAALILRWFDVPVLIATSLAIAFGLLGIVIMILFSRKHHKMIHCAVYCPIGTIVNIMKPLNPFRLYIDNSCNQCMKCTTFCKFDALNFADVRNKKPNFSCTLCGDCLSACHDNSIKYKYLNLSSESSRNLYILLTVTLHAVFLALARI